MVTNRALQSGSQDSQAHNVAHLLLATFNKIERNYMETCKRCGGSPIHWIQNGSDYFCIDCFYINLGESYGKESVQQTCSTTSGLHAEGEERSGGQTHLRKLLRLQQANRGGLLRTLGKWWNLLKDMRAH